MDISEIRKIVNDGLVKYKAYKEADRALDALDSLSQAEKDLSRVVSGLEKQRDSLKAENGVLGEKIKEAQIKADGIIARAEQIQATAIEAAEKLAKEDELNAAASKRQADEYIASLKAEKETLESEVKAAKKELHDIKAEINDAVESMKRKIRA